ncbi:hypothetical protein TUBRATIS_28540 [Tubulinosema ratisbonensis]|uniref:RING-type domain-containing protein n=1 Tax=Tubulinosema ratisbonensis TaxID=291195 RepID=A0A437AI25_9MICR|nr:hypothetical protein TUBRATIS_28540 [Tubulinosema ratisbonensis]
MDINNKGINSLDSSPKEISSFYPRIFTIDTSGKIPVIRETVFIEREPSSFFFIAYLFQILVVIIMVQLVYFIWNKVHPKSCKVTMLTLLTIFPLFLSKYVIFIWLIYLFFIFFNFKNRFTLFFYLCNLFNLLYLTILTSQIFLVFCFFANFSIFLPFLIFLISIYFAVLSREIVYFLKDQKFVITKIVEDNCALCNKLLKSDKVMSLSCKCTFHVKCLKGWSRLGNKDFCPFCNGKVVSQVMSVWDKQIEGFLSLLDYAKGGIYLLFVIVLFCRFKE